MKILTIGLGVHGPNGSCEIRYDGYSRQIAKFRLVKGFYKNIDAIDFPEFNQNGTLIINAAFAVVELLQREGLLWDYIGKPISLERHITPRFPAKSLTVKASNLKKAKGKKCTK